MTPLSFAAAFVLSPLLAAQVTVDAAHNRRPISPDIYGVVFAKDTQLSRMGVTVRRHGGNHWSRYNWKTSTTSTGGDGYFFRTVVTPAGPLSSSADNFVTATRALRADAVMELPAIGHVSKALPTTPADGCSFRVTKYGVQQQVDPTAFDCGNGVHVDGGFVVNDPFDTAQASDAKWTTDWVAHLVATFGAGAQGGVKYYNLSNQPALWHTTHRDIHPQPSTYAEIKASLEAHGKAVKDADPTALTLGPGAWGWLEYFDSAAGDRVRVGQDFIPYYLSQARLFEEANLRRILDYLDVHAYPQAKGVSAGDTSPVANRMRLRSTRILWDPTYVAESWEDCCYGGILNVIPRMRTWIADYYPGTKLALGSYAWGAIDTVNGAITQAELLGIFGRERVDMALLEDPPADGALGEDAFKLYRNYDGEGAHFGSTSIRARVQDVDSMSSFAAIEGTSKVTLVLINKDVENAQVANVFFEGTGKTGEWRAFDFGPGKRLAPSGAGSLIDGTLSRSVPASTATIIEFVPTEGVFAADGGDFEEPVAPTPLSGATVDPGVLPRGCGCTGTEAALFLGAFPVLWVLRRRAR